MAYTKLFFHKIILELIFMKGYFFMNSNRGMDFKHKEVININDGKRLRFC